MGREPYDLQALRKSILFRNMTDEEIAMALDTMKPRKRVFGKNDRIVQDGDFSPEMAVLLSGSVQLFHIDPEGNSNLLEVLEPGDTIGMLNAVGGYRLHLSARSMGHTELLFIRVDGLLRKNVLTAPVQIRFLQNLTLALAQKAHRLSIRIEESVRRSTRDRIQTYLSAQYHKKGTDHFSIPLKRQEMADFLFADRSAMSGELCRMRDEGLIRFEKNRFELLKGMPVAEEENDPNEEE